MQQSEQARDAREVQVFLFADLAGFTALTEAHGDELAADLVEEFSRATTRLLSQYEAELVKIIGDALMLRVPAPARAIELGLALTGPILAEYGYPAVHVGMHYGPAVNRAGEWIGATINLAARISGPPPAARYSSAQLPARPPWRSTVSSSATAATSASVT